MVGHDTPATAGISRLYVPRGRSSLHDRRIMSKRTESVEPIRCFSGRNSEVEGKVLALSGGLIGLPVN